MNKNTFFSIGNCRNILLDYHNLNIVNVEDCFIDESTHIFPVNIRVKLYCNHLTLEIVKKK